MSKKSYEMNFSEFAEAIRPGRSGWLTNPLKRSLDSAEWLANVWRTTDVRITYGINWRNGILKNELPPEAREYEFDDLLLHPTTTKLGLDPASGEDNRKAAELLAIRNAWIASIQNRYGQTKDVAACFELSLSAAAEYVLLTSDCIQHPWIQWRVRQHIADQNLKQLEQASKPAIPVEMSNDPKWPSVTVIHGRATEPSAQDISTHEEEKKDIRYWLKEFKSEEGLWTSEFDVYAYDAECDINIARLKIAALQKIIEKQEALILDCDRIIKKNKRLEASVMPSKNIGRPEKSTERQEVALRFTSQWVQFLMDALDIKNCAQLEAFIDGSSQRNWRRWLSSQAVPTRKNLSELLTAEIRQGRYKGKSLHNVPTTPEHNDLLALISMT